MDHTVEVSGPTGEPAVDSAGKVDVSTSRRDAAERGRLTRVLAGLGWPGSGDEVPAAAEEADLPAGPSQPSRRGRGHAQRLGWPVSVNVAGSPQVPLVHPQGEPTDAGVPDGDSGSAVGTVDASPVDVSRETTSAVPGPDNDDAVDVSRETTTAGPSAADPGVPPSVRTAAEVAAQALENTDASTPLARSAAHSLLVREGRRLEDPLPRPDRARVMVVANQKGGVGKTTSTVNMAAALAQHGQRVLVVDLDPQGNASTALAIDHHRGTPSTYDALVDGMALTDIVQSAPESENLWVVPATIDLAGAEIDLVSLVARESRLRKAILAYPPVTDEGEDRLDYVLIDCPPSLGLLTLNALVAGEEMMIPIQAEYYALEGLGQLLETVEMVRAHLNPGLVVSTILLTMYDARTRLAAGVAEEVRTHFGQQVLRTSIPRSVRISEAPSYGQTVMTYDPGSAGALSYLEAAREMALKGVTA